MIQAMVFDLDGTLVQSEKLKARSYAEAAKELRPEAIEEDEVIEAFKEFVGRTRKEVGMALTEKFHLEDAARERSDEFEGKKPWQVFVALRMRKYKAMIADPKVTWENRRVHNLALLQQARVNGLQVALATNSHWDEARPNLEALGLRGAFDFIATADDVENQKPDPEIYLLIADELSVAPPECLVLEDSPSGVKAALAAKMKVIAVSTSFTRKALRDADIINERWIVDDPHMLDTVVQEQIAATE